MSEELEKFDLETIDKTFTHFKVGAKVIAKVVAESTTGFIVNIGGKKDGFIPKNEEEYKALDSACASIRVILISFINTVKAKQ